MSCCRPTLNLWLKHTAWCKIGALEDRLSASRCRIANQGAGYLIYTRLCIYIYPYICTCTNTFVYVYIYACNIWIYIHACNIFIYAQRIYIHLYTHTHIYVYTHIWIYVSKYVSMYVYKYILVYNRVRPVSARVLRCKPTAHWLGRYRSIRASDYRLHEVATISRLPKNIGFFCERALKKRLYSAKETYILKEPTNHSHPIPCMVESTHSSMLAAPLHTPPSALHAPPSVWQYTVATIVILPKLAPLF